MQYANKILYAETGIEPLEVKWRAEKRKGFARHLKYEYGKEHPCFGCIVNKWKDERITKHKPESTKERKTILTFEIYKDKKRMIDNHANRWEIKDPEELWVYMNGSKKDNEAGISLVLMGGDEMVEEENRIRVPGEWHITKIAICAMGMALRDIGKIGKRKIRIFSDSLSGIILIKDMECEGERAAIWVKLTDVLNEWEEVKFTWIPGHVGIEGNKIADMVAKRISTRD